MAERLLSDCKGEGRAKNCQKLASNRQASASDCKAPGAGGECLAGGRSRRLLRSAVLRLPRTVLNGEPTAFVQSMTGFVALRPKDARFPIQAFGNDVGGDFRAFALLRPIGLQSTPQLISY